MESKVNRDLTIQERFDGLYFRYSHFSIGSLVTVDEVYFT